MHVGDEGGLVEFAHFRRNRVRFPGAHGIQFVVVVGENDEMKQAQADQYQAEKPRE